MNMETILLATGNSGKIKELQALLAPIKCMAPSRFNLQRVEETAPTFVENALLKARYASQRTDLPVLADDSGLVVPALGGAPGIFSARYAGLHASDQDNIQLLLKNMEALPPAQRHAFFYCAIVLIQYPADPTPIIAFGKIDGILTTKPQGAQGFGYDPIFYVPSQGCTMAELPATVKNTLSHRAQALAQLRRLLDLKTHAAN